VIHTLRMVYWTLYPIDIVLVDSCALQCWASCALRPWNIFNESHNSHYEVPYFCNAVREHYQNLHFVYFRGRNKRQIYFCVFFSGRLLSYFHAHTERKYFLSVLLVNNKKLEKSSCGCFLSAVRSMHELEMTDSSIRWLVLVFHVVYVSLT
jgi:hypothetical protein